MGLLDSNRLLLVIYILAAALALFLIFTFFFQYIAAIGSIKEITAAFVTPRIVGMLWLSVASAIVTTVIAIILGVPMAYVFAMKEFSAKALVETLSVEVPQTFPPIAEGMIFLLMLGPHSPFGINIAFTFSALVIAKLFVCAPFVVSLSARRFREIKETGINLTARSLGANQFQVFRTIFLPLAARDIMAGAALCWARAMGELGGSLLFAGVIPFKTEIIPTFIATQATTLTTASLAATIIGTTASMVALVFFKRVTRRAE